MLIGAWLRQQREARSWARREMAHRLTQAAHAVGDTTVPGIEHLCTYIRRWEYGRHGPTERYVLYYCTVFGIRVSQFGKAPLPERPLSMPTELAYRETEGSDPGRLTVEREVVMAGHEAGDHAEQAESQGIGEVTLEQVRADVVRLSRLTATGEPVAAFRDMRRVRDRIYRLLDRQLRPRERTDLYFLLGCLNGLMGVTANYLGFPDAAEEMHRSGLAYASTIEHKPLMAQLRLRLSTVAYWRGMFQTSRDLAVGALQYVSHGSPGANLQLNAARAAAAIGDVDAARQSVADAHEAVERDYTDELVQIGGEFVNSLATHYCLAGAALARARGLEREAAGELEQAISLYDEGPREDEDHWFAGKPLAGIDLAVVRLRSGALDAATAALEPALSLPAAQRITQVTTRLAAVRDELAASIYRGSAQAHDLGEQIEEFGRDAATAGLHTLRGVA